MLRVGYFNREGGKLTFDTEIIAMDIQFVETGMTFIGRLITKDEELSTIDFKVDAYQDLVFWAYYNYKLPKVSETQLSAIAKDFFKLLLSAVSMEVLEWLSNKIFEKIQYSKALYNLKSDEYLSSNELLNVNKVVLELLSELFVYGVVLPVVHDEFDLKSSVVLIRANGVDKLIEVMKAKYGDVSKKENVEGMVVKEASKTQEILNAIKERPMTLSELSSEFGLPIPLLRSILVKNGAIQDELTGAWYLPNEEKANEAYNILYNYALEKKTSIISLDEAIRALEQFGFSDTEASAYVSYLGSEGKVIVRNGLVEIPEVRNSLTVKTSKVSSPKRMTKTEKEKVYDEVKDIAMQYVNGDIELDEAIDVLIKGAETLNKTTYTKMCRVFLNTIRENDKEKYNLITSEIRNEFGTISCSKLYDIINSKFKKGESIYPTIEERETPYRASEESEVKGEEEEVEYEEKVEEYEEEKESEVRESEKSAEEGEAELVNPLELLAKMMGGG